MWVIPGFEGRQGGRRLMVVVRLTVAGLRIVVCPLSPPLAPASSWSRARKNDGKRPMEQEATTSERALIIGTCLISRN